MENIKKEIQKEEQPIEQLLEEVAPTPKRKTRTRKPKAVPDTSDIINMVEKLQTNPSPQIEQTPEPALESPRVQPELKPGKKIKVVEMVSCPKCNKEMNKKSLRYSHEKTCTGNVITEEKPVKRRTPIRKKEEAKPEAQVISIPEQIIEQEINNIFNNQRELRLSLIHI